MEFQAVFHLRKQKVTEDKGKRVESREDMVKRSVFVIPKLKPFTPNFFPQSVQNFPLLVCSARTNLLKTWWAFSTSIFLA